MPASTNKLDVLVVPLYAKQLDSNIQRATCKTRDSTSWHQLQHACNATLPYCWQPQTITLTHA